MALSQLAGISQGYISDIENGRRRLNSDTAGKIANGVGIDFDSLRGELEKCLGSAGLVDATGRWPAESKLGEHPGEYRTPQPKPPPGDPMTALCRWYVSSLSRPDAAALVGNFMAEYQSGDDDALLRATALMQLLAEKR